MGYNQFMNLKIILIILFTLIIGGLVGFYFGYDVGFEKARTPDVVEIVNPEIDNFEKCAVAGYPVMESYPRQCRTPDGKNFVEEVTVEPPVTGDGVACTMDAKICPDGSSVGRIPPDCEFAPCPDEPTL